MPTQAELDWKNVVNTNRSKDLRASREVSRERKDKMNDSLRNATSTKDRRAIKKQFNVDTNKASSQTDNQSGVNEDSNQRGDDVFKPSYRDDSPPGSIDVVWCVNGEPFEGTANGTIGDAIT